MWRRVLIATGLIAAFAGPAAQAREWTDISGKHHVNARLLQCRDNQVWLEKANSKLVIIPIEKLSLSDRTYVVRECPGQVSTREVSARVAAAAGIAKTAQPAKPSVALERSRSRATVRLASLNRRQDPPEEEVELPAEEMPAEEAAEEPAEDAAGDTFAEEPAAAEEPASALQPTDTPAADEPGTAAQSPAEELPGPEAVKPAAAPAKYIYTGRCGTFHLIDKIGTGAYWYKGKHYLAMLFKAGEDDNYLYYDSNHPDGQVIQWYFSKSERCCKFWVWKRTETGHGHYEREYREQPN